MINNDNKKKMSYSMIVDNNYFRNNKFKKKYILVRERDIHSWVKNDSVTKCYNCEKTFRFYLRKHHCRACGRIFCHYCTLKKIELPNDIEKFPNEPNYWSKSIENILMWKDNIKQRVCDKCYDRLCHIKKIKNLIKTFIIIDCDLLDIYNFLSVCKTWNKAAVHILSKFREIQYKLPTQKLTDYEKKMLWINREYLVGHSKWITKLIISVDLKNKKQINDLNELLLKNNKNNKISCYNIFCTRYCTNKLTAEDALELLRIDIFSDSIQKYITNSFLNISEDEFICYIPYITYYLYNQPHLADVLLKKSLESVNIRIQFYWSIIYQSQIKNKEYYLGVCKCLLELIEHNLGIDEVNKLKLTNTTVDYFKDIKLNKLKNIKILYNPLNPLRKYDGIDINNINIKNSATNPVIIPLYYYINNVKYIDEVMFKNENVLKDQIVVNIIKLIDIILKREENLDLDIVKYKVLPISKNSGLVEIIKNSVTIYDILEKKKSTIQNFIIDNNKDKKISEIRDKFIKSTAAYCIISYLLGLGDRHLDNIMISKSGALFHIDFGYILGHDPKYKTQNIKITPDILDAMGGSNSTDYIYFQKICTQIYNCLRRHVGLFMNLLIILPDIDNNFTIDYLQEEIINRFEPGENIIEAKLHLVNKINNSSQTYEHTVVDFVHKSFKENKILSNFNSLFKIT